MSVTYTGSTKNYSNDVFMKYLNNETHNSFFYGLAGNEQIKNVYVA